MTEPIYSFRLPAQLKEALAVLKERDGMTASDAIRRGLVALLKERGISVKPAGKGGAKRKSRRTK